MIDRTHKVGGRLVGAVICSSLLLSAVLTPTAVAGGSVTATHRGAESTASVPTADITGKPAHFTPSRLSVTALGTNPSECPKSQYSFYLRNEQQKSETLHITGTNFATYSTKIPATVKGGQCIGPTNYSGTVIYKLSDGKKLILSVSSSS